MSLYVCSSLPFLGGKIEKSALYQGILLLSIGYTGQFKTIQFVQIAPLLQQRGKKSQRVLRYSLALMPSSFLNVLAKWAVSA